jgi:hypothetical protein
MAMGDDVPSIGIKYQSRICLETLECSATQFSFLSVRDYKYPNSYIHAKAYTAQISWILALNRASPQSPTLT